MIYADRELAQKLERTEARANADFVETRARLQPESGACWIDVGGAYAMFDGVDSPCTQTFGLGMFSEPTDEQLDELEDLFRSRSSAVFHEVSPLADPSLLPMLVERGYHPIEHSNVLFLDLRSRPVAGSASAVTSRVINEDEVELWARTSAAGWASEHESLGEFMLGFGRISAQTAGSFPYLGELDGNAIATGMLFVFDDVCILAGASTVPEARRRGAQNALFETRLAHAADLGSRLAMMAAAPGSQSQMNAQKNGFAIAYTRTKWQMSV